jgi:hypothetical protein
MVYQWFSLKTIRTVFSGLATKSVVMIFGFSLKTKVVDDFLIWISKPVVTV